MIEYIKREDALAAVKRIIGDQDHECKAMMDFYSALWDASAADVAEVRHGRWEYEPQTINTLSRLKCSKCGWWTLDPSVDGVYHYCPNCGAKMDKEDWQ